MTAATQAGIIPDLTVTANVWLQFGYFPYCTYGDLGIAVHTRVICVGMMMAGADEADRRGLVVRRPAIARGLPSGPLRQPVFASPTIPPPRLSPRAGSAMTTSVHSSSERQIPARHGRPSAPAFPHRPSMSSSRTVRTRTS